MKPRHNKKRTIPKAEPAALYPRISFRLPQSYMRRIETLKRESGLSFGAIVQNCIVHTLPALEERHGVR